MIDVLKIIIYFVLIFLIGYIFLNSYEYFEESDMIIFKRLNGNFIKKFKVDRLYNIYNDEIIKLFNEDESIKITIPSPYSIELIYKLKNGGYSRTINLTSGEHSIKKNIDNETIDQLNIKSNNDKKVTSNKIIVVDRYGRALFETDNENTINWNLIYNDYGFDDYNVIYPWGRRMFYHNNYPYRYRRHNKYIRKPGTPLKNLRRRRY